uniref:Uncharacterized protein n=1 Tax=Rhipicephalus microplus TaxID=6941 RepID=A0A6G5AEW8_RHIMP
MQLLCKFSLVILYIYEVFCVLKALNFKVRKRKVNLVFTFQFAYFNQLFCLDKPKRTRLKHFFLLSCSSTALFLIISAQLTSCFIHCRNFVNGGHISCCTF